MTLPTPSKDFATVAWDWGLRAAIVLGLALIVYGAFLGRFLRPLLDSAEAAEASPWFRYLLRPSVLWAGMGSLLLVFRTALWFSYRPVPSATMESAPPLTVIIPAYNEGPMVAQSIDSVAGARYPQGRLEIFVVDDGSSDDTWEHIQRAAARHPGIVTALRFPRNRGKRAALAAGFRRARGEVLVTIDSDSVIEEGTLLAIVAPFENERVGAVAGRVAVYNRSAGIIPRMLHVRYTLSFDLMRAAQSTFGTVYCCPGALAAYRASVVRRVLPGWMEQTFLGSPCTYGEDRAMTNDILASGHDAVYQRTAVVHTMVPTTYRQLVKMLIRWDRSYVREELRFARIVWTRPLRARLIALCDAVITNLGYPLGYVTLALLITRVASDPLTIVRMLVAIGVTSLFSMLYFLRAERSWAFVYGVAYSYFSFFALFWLFPYAVLTVRSRSWMTR